ncbi:MAG TPA: hypothetical protein VJ044_05590, partial [Candidatus Hodarchaeales archaeon]|nr:hypothetical protein [Candidatus Hodarchaeales archaeon]
VWKEHFEAIFLRESLFENSFLKWFHGFLVVVGQKNCLKRSPICKGCPLAAVCKYGGRLSIDSYVEER